VSSGPSHGSAAPSIGSPADRLRHGDSGRDALRRVRVAATRVALTSTAIVAAVYLVTAVVVLLIVSAREGSQVDAQLSRALATSTAGGTRSRRGIELSALVLVRRRRRDRDRLRSPGSAPGMHGPDLHRQRAAGVAQSVGTAPETSPSEATTSG